MGRTFENRKPPGDSSTIDEEDVFERLAGGEPTSSIATSYGLSVRSLFRWRKNGGEERQGRWDEAMRESASALVEQAGEILDDLEGSSTSGLTPAMVALAGKRADHRRWMAERRDPEAFGDKAPTITFNVGALHLDALRQVGSMNRPPARALLEAEVVGDTE